MSKTPTVPEVGPWAQEKLKCLGDYLAAYTMVLRKQNFKGYVYIDAFAGAGTAKIRKKGSASDQQVALDLLGGVADEEQEEFIRGSPRIALDLQHPFTNYVFVELKEKRRNELLKLQQHYDKSRNIKIYDKNCNEYLRELAENKKINWKEWRGVVFLDPFGAHVPWSTIQGLAATKSFEVFINFPCMAINRLADNDGELKDEHRKILDEYFGSPDWFDVMYQEQSADLFGSKGRNKKNDAQKKLLNWYRNRLKTEFGHASSARLIRNTRNSPMYYLIWAGPNATGQRIASHILSQGEAI